MTEIDINKIVDAVVDKIVAEGNLDGVSLGDAPTPAAAGGGAFVKDRVRRVAIGCDHTCVSGKNGIKAYLETLGYVVTDVGCDGSEKVDYPDIAAAVARKVAGGQCERGIMLDGAGIGSSMVCNKVRGIRAALCYDIRTIVSSREHNNANVLTLGGPLHGSGELCEMARLWLETPFAGGRHWPRVNKLMATERERK
ncbi:MAG: RpiB/LacA/LacB family sugar-phosphate isomerase [Phycisphaerae bacterium]|nr:RpiB/LacA/LacB family sugar-phosphate isomerase [Phycisphaerae bacterium]